MTGLKTLIIDNNMTDANQHPDREPSLMWISSLSNALVSTVEEQLGVSEYGQQFWKSSCRRLGSFWAGLQESA